MDPMTIFMLVERGLTLIPILIKAGENAGPAIKALKDLVTGARTGTVTQAEIDKTEALLDSLIAEFNADI